MQISGDHFQLTVTSLANLPAKKTDRTEFYRAQTSIVLAKEFGIAEEITRTSSGVPELSGQKISISHSDRFLSVMIADVPCGIDIQVPDRSLNKGKDWFYNEKESANLGSDPTEEQLYAIWCAKEAFYKLFAGEINDLKNDVTALKVSDDCVIIDYSGECFEISLKKTPDYYLAYCVLSHSD